MLYGSVNAMCSNGRAGSFSGLAHSAAKLDDRADRRQHDVERLARRDGGIAQRGHLAVAEEHLFAGPARRAARPFGDVRQHPRLPMLRQHLAAPAMSACARSASRPSTISRVENGATGSTMAPSRSNARAAAATASRTCGSTGRPQPASRCRPMRRPFNVTIEVEPVDRAAAAGSSRRASRAATAPPSCAPRPRRCASSARRRGRRTAA